MTKTQILITANPPSSQQGMVVTLESTGLFLGALVSISMLLTGAVQIISMFNSMKSSIRDLREDVNKLSAIDKTIKEIVKDFSVMDKRFEIHLKDCENRKETEQMLLGQLNEKIDHKAKRFEDEIKSLEQKVSSVLER